MTLTVHDRAVDGTARGELTLELLTERITVRELIRSRVYQEVTEYNARRVVRWAGLAPLDPDADASLPGRHRAASIGKCRSSGRCARSRPAHC
jgi:hypothetical protein